MVIRLTATAAGGETDAGLAALLSAAITAANEPNISVSVSGNVITLNLQNQEAHLHLQGYLLMMLMILLQFLILRLLIFKEIVTVIMMSSELLTGRSVQ